MDARSAATAKLLFVLSDDFGELCNAAYLVTGTGFRGTMLMPPSLFELNQKGLPAEARPYRTLADVIEAVDREDPDVVFLFCGYLYAANKIFDVATLAQLVGALRERRCQVVTSDPFLGVMASVDESTFSDAHPLKAGLTQHFSAVSDVLKDLTHLYVIDPAGFAATPSAYFYNERIEAAPQALTEVRSRLTARSEIDGSRQRWLFVLSMEDYGGQSNRIGRPRFDEILVRKLAETVEQGRQPVLLAPGPCIESVRAAASRVEGAILLPFCAYDLFLDLLLEAEYVLYWNLFSSSVPLRLVNGLPFFAFDPGHMAAAMPPVFEVGMREYYRDAPLIYLDQNRPLSAEGLDRLKPTFEELGMADARRHFRSSRTPEAMVAGLLEETP